MSEYLRTEEIEKYLYAIIRKPQEGKTFICLENINQSQDNLNIIVTMNTIKSNNQFFERANQKFGEDNICVLNSRSKTNDIISVKDKIYNGISILIMCAHYKRFDKSIIDLLKILNDSMQFKKKVCIHIDEAHAYIPVYREKIIEMNNLDIIERIYLYSATPFNIWQGKYEISNSLFNSIYIVDIEEQYNIIKNDHYFGVRNSNFEVGYPDEPLEYDTLIPDTFIKKWGNEKQRANIDNNIANNWYTKYPFQLGNEIAHLSFVKNILNKLKTTISNDSYSYNFVPGYVRKLTHYAIMENILDIYNKGIVFVINGDGTKVYMKVDEDIVSKIPDTNNEPSKQIENFIKKYPNRPVFITGFHCVGMSVTFINETIGNFDNVIFSHDQYISTPDILYQLCRFVFNYMKWKNKNTIKKTKLYFKNNECLDICLKYENQIDIIDRELSGSIRTKDEIVGDVPIKPSKKPKELQFASLKPYSSVCKLKTFRVEEDDNPDKILDKVKAFYKDFTGKELIGRSMPKKDQGFYKCSTTKNSIIQIGVDKLKQTLKGFKWDSNYQLIKNKFKYARVYVVYDDNKDNSEYTWIIRRMEIRNCEEVNAIWRKIEANKIKST